MVWHECSLICSDACGCTAWRVAPTPRTAMPVAIQLEQLAQLAPLAPLAQLAHLAHLAQLALLGTVR